MYFRANTQYHLSEKIIKVFVERNIPIEFVTKASIPGEVIDLIKQQSHSFGQVSLLTLNEDLRKILVPRGVLRIIGDGQKNQRGKHRCFRSIQGQYRVVADAFDLFS